MNNIKINIRVTKYKELNINKIKKINEGKIDFFVQNLK